MFFSCWKFFEVTNDLAPDGLPNYYDAPHQQQAKDTYQQQTQPWLFHAVKLIASFGTIW
jgi:hypothetical protein